jgi:hypothetical protein
MDGGKMIAGFPFAVGIKPDGEWGITCGRQALTGQKKPERLI